MARRVFFSFHYKRDVRRVVQVRNSWVVRPSGDAQPFLDKAEWESIKRSGDQAIQNWIERQLQGTSVTVVLIGRETATRRWVQYEIRRSRELGKGILGIRIHNLKDPSVGSDLPGDNPLDKITTQSNGRNVRLSSLYHTYDWVSDNGFVNLPAWIETAARAAGR